MRKRHPNHRLVKLHRSYTVEEIANLFGIHKNTVRGWVKAGLATIDAKRPMLILGHDLSAFLQARRKKTSRLASREKFIALDVEPRNFLRLTWRNIHLLLRNSAT